MRVQNQKTDGCTDGGKADNSAAIDQLVFERRDQRDELNPEILAKIAGEFGVGGGRQITPSTCQFFTF